MQSKTRRDTARKSERLLTLPGMPESFVKTFKRDYVHMHPLNDARTAMEQLPKWFEDYNENHPHKSLKMKSPREFRKQQLS